VTRQTLVQERVIGVQQVENAAVLAHHRSEKQSGLFQHRGPHPLTEPGKTLRVGRKAIEPLQLQPLKGKVVDQSLRFRILQHPLDLGIQVRAQTTLRGKLRQLVVGHGAPQEIRQPRGQLELVQQPYLGAVGPVVQFGAEQELGRAQHGLHGQTQAIFARTAMGDHRSGQLRKTRHFLLGGRPAIRSQSESLQNLPHLLGWRPAGIACQQSLLAGRPGIDRTILDGSLDDTLGGRQVPFHQYGRHRQHVANVVKTVANVVGGKILRGIKVDADQVANRVAVLGPIQPPYRDAPRVGLGIARRSLERTSHRAKKGVALVRRGLRQIFRWHAPCLDHPDHDLPTIALADDGRIVAKFCERQARLGLRTTVAIQAVFLDERYADVRETGGRRSIRGRHRGRESQAGEGQCQHQGHSGIWKRRHAS
jgi:hypothetical protein